MIVAYIDAYRARFGVEPICAVLTEHGITIAPSTYHAHKACPVSPAALEQAYLANALYTLWVETPAPPPPPAVPAWPLAGTRSGG